MICLYNSLKLLYLQLLTYGRRIPFAELFARIDAVDASAVKRAADRFLFDRVRPACFSAVFLLHLFIELQKPSIHLPNCFYHLILIVMDSGGISMMNDLYKFIDFCQLYNTTDFFFFAFYTQHEKRITIVIDHYHFFRRGFLFA